MVKILHLSDLHMNKKELNDINIVLKALLKDIKKQAHDIDFILFNGDLINNGSQGWKGDNEYQLAIKHFLDPLIETTSLTRNEVFFVPGNHDIDRTKIKKLIDDNLSDKFNKREELNEFIDNYSDYESTFFSRLDNYEMFLSQFYNDYNKYELISNRLIKTYIVEKDSHKIGIAAINSSWCAFGGLDDKNKMLIGERQLDKVLESLENVDVRIAMFHHPLDWLKDFDRESIYNLLIENFDMVLMGHMHTHKPAGHTINNSLSFIYQCSSLYDGRNLNGYAIHEIDVDSKILKSKFRKYYDQRREFDKALEVCADGELTHSLKAININLSENIKKNETRKSNLVIRNKIKERAIHDLNQTLITTVSINTVAPKELNELYVPPLISNTPESQNEDKIIFFDLENLLQLQENIIFVGKKELGKTTLMSYICYSLLHSINEEIKIPIFIDFDNLPPGKNIVEKAINNFLNEYDIYDFPLAEALNSGDLILLLDNFSYNLKRVEHINSFIKKYPTIRVIMSANEDILETMQIKDFPELYSNFSEYYLFSYNRNQTRQLVKKWFSKTNVNSDEILDRVVQIVNAVGIPKNPLSISLLLSIIENQRNYTPINEATLVDRFTEGLLEKLNIDEVKYETYDYAIKSDYLSYIASLMVKKGMYHLEEMEYEKESLNYFVSKSLDTNITNFRESFFKKGILIKTDKKVYFRFQCFFELFVAKYMSVQENEDFRRNLLSKENYLTFQNEIVYFTGLTRRNTYGVIDVLENRLLETFKEIDMYVDIEKFTNISIGELLSDNLKDADVKNKLENFTITEKEKDNILDKRSHTIKHVQNDLIQKKDYNDPFSEIWDNINLYSKAIKNLELEDTNIKKRTLKISINRFTKLIGFLYKVILDKLFEMKKEKKIQEHDWKDLEYVLKTGIPLVIQHQVYQSVGSPKLKSVIKELIQEVETDFEKFMLVCLYSDMRMEKFIEELERCFRNNKYKIIKQTGLAKLMHYRAFYSLSERDTEKLINLIVELGDDFKHSHPVVKNINKTFRVKKLKQQKMLQINNGDLK